MKKNTPKIKPLIIINKTEIARRLGLTPQYVGQLLNGKRGNQERLEQIQKILRKELKHVTRREAA